MYCIWRWHKHNLSSPRVDALRNADEDEQARGNRKNTRLAIAKHLFFYEEADNENGIFSGGVQKLTHATSGKPPLKLTGKGSPLHTLLSKLYRLLKSHYKATNMDDLEPYSADGPATPTPQRPQAPSTGPSKPAFRFRDPSPVSDFGSSDSQSNTFSSSDPSSSSPEEHEEEEEEDADGSETDTPSASPTTRRRPMDGHKAITKIFSSVMVDGDGKLRDMDKYMEDKLYDQFNDGVVVIEGHIKNPTGSGKSGSGKSGSGKSGTSKTGGGKAAAGGGKTASTPLNQAGPSNQAAPPEQIAPSTTPGDASTSAEVIGDAPTAAAQPDTPGDAPLPGGTAAVDGAATAPTAAGKRKADEVPDLRSNPRPRRIQKKTVNHGMLYPY